MRFGIREKNTVVRFCIFDWLRSRTVVFLMPVAAMMALAGSIPAYGQTCPTPGGICATPGNDGAGGTLTGVLNAYYPGTANAAAGSTTITLGTASASGAQTAISSGDLLLVIQMQGADITSSNNSNYGDGSTGSGYTVNGNLTAGLYEFVKAASNVAVTGGTRNLTIVGGGTGTGLINSYVNANYAGGGGNPHGQRRFQVIRVPQYTTATLSSGLTAAPWNGTTGGVLAIDVATTLTLGGTVSVDGLGFRGGGPQQLTGGTGGTNNDYATASGNNYHGNKAEGIAGTPRYVFDSGALLNTGAEGYPNGSRAKGAPGNAGGGGSDADPAANDQNSGGGGGGNGGAGGTGGLAWNSQLVDGGLGGAVFAQVSPCRIVMGGGGGQGTRNNSSGIASTGAAGGGIVIIRTRYVTGTGTITANGADAYNDTANDGGGGGGAGGTVIVSALSSDLSGLTVQAHGGKGGDAWDASGPGSNCVCAQNNHHGPGGGGGGGVVYLSSAAASIDVTAGAHGTSTTDAATFGSTAGSDGISSTAVTPDQIPGVFSGAQCTPTAVKIEWFKAERRGQAVEIKWRTGFEVDNLGFNVYRDLNGQRVKVNPSLLAGSALIARRSAMLTAGWTYSWVDNPPDGGRSAIYWLEDIDLHGKRTWHGPMGVDFAAEPDSPGESNRATLLTQLGRSEAGASVSQSWRIVGPVTRGSGDVTPKAKFSAEGMTAKPGTLAGMPAIKISVRDDGWYRIARQDLLAAGLDPKADPQTLQMFVNGFEMPISVVGSRSSFAVEFYGVGADTASTNLQVYWLIWGYQNGLRIPVLQGNGVPSASTGFPYTIQVKERSVYFPGVLNGEKENFFGSPVTSDAPEIETIPVSNLDASATGPALLQVAIQGVTAVPHQVQVSFNGSAVGEVDFNGVTDGVATLSLPASMVQPGSNQVSLLALGGDSDVSLVDYVALTYSHTYSADGNSLQLTAAGNQAVTVGGFSNSTIRVFDVTNPTSVSQLTGSVQQIGGSFSVTFTDPGPGTRTVLALSDDQVKSAASVVYNTPSNWGQPGHGADMVIITRSNFFNDVAPLAALRASQGLKVAVIDVVDLYDEFAFGQKDPQAIKSFLAYASSYWHPAPRFVLLVGDASYDPKNYLGYGDFDLVPSKLIDTQALETASDDWFVDFSGDEIPAMAIGRLPARTTQEVDQMVGKILNYENTGQYGGALLVNDVSDDYNFAGASLQLRPLLPSTMPVTIIDRGTSPSAESDLINAINGGQKIVNYVGHGSIDIWRDNLLTDSSALSLLNGQDLPLFSLMTCLNGAFNDPALDSLAESLLKAPQGGAAAVWASSGITDPSAQGVMNRNFFNLLFGASITTNDNSGGGNGNGGGGNGSGNGGNGGNGGGGSSSALTIGEAAARAKIGVSDPDVRATWILFGDPAMRLKK